MADELFATLVTNRGDIVVSLFEHHAPVTVENFVGLANGTKTYVDPNTARETKGRNYDGTTYHR